MTFFATDAVNFKLAEGVTLDAEEADRLQVGSGFKLVYDKDHSETATVDALGHLMTGDGVRLDDLVADISVGGQRSGMRYLGPGPMGQRWVIVGPPYDEKLAD